MASVVRLPSSLVVIVFCYRLATAAYCSRESSRVVRHVLHNNIYPAFTDVGATPSPSLICPFQSSRDLYYKQEQHKTMETINKWNCEFCGKAFMSEKYLDKHFDNRHSQHVRQGSDNVCLADYCNFFRCDIVLGTRKPDFWDLALCLEDDMEDMGMKCRKLLFECVSNDLTENSTAYVKDRINETVCSYMTCGRYWDAPLPQGSVEKSVVFFIISSVFVIFFLVVYYCVVYHYFYADESDYEKMEYHADIASLRNEHVRRRIAENQPPLD